ncbi:MAG: ABC transporter ATP-binding protein [Spirochaetaceae bacterium]|nr:ABC transporter ATP-binding protein [Spirochaetaceae bacterium]
MSFIQFQDVRFAYPPVEGDVDQDGNQIIPGPIFDHCSAELPGGFVSLVGPNASGKSTFMLLAAGRIFPEQGKIFLLGKDTSTLSEEEREKLASFIYQNMEFETDDIVSELLNYVYTNGCFAGKADKINSQDLLSQVTEVLELDGLMNHKLNGLSKGEMQRVILAFSLLYGSQSIFMDEPLFAMENAQKHKALKFIKEYCAVYGTNVYISMHELDLNRIYPENILLFYPNRDMEFGTPEEILTEASLEKAYGVPAAMLKDSEALTRKALQEQYEN